MTKVAGFSKKNKSKIVYPDCESALKPVPHDEENPVPFPPAAGAAETDSSDENTEDDVTVYESYDEDFEEGRPHLISQGDLDDLVRDLSLSKEKSELLASRLGEWNLPQKGTTNITLPLSSQRVSYILQTGK